MHDTLTWRFTLFIMALSALMLAICAPSQAGASSARRGTITVGEAERTYELYVPQSVAGADAVPLVIALHPFASSGKAWRALTGFDALAEDRGFIVAYPDAADLDWDDGSLEAGGWHALDTGDDIAFVGALIDELVARYAVDPARVYLTGFAAGGTFAYRAACEMPERFAKVAVSGALMWDFIADNCVAADDFAPVSLLVLHGSVDGDYPLEGRSAATPDGTLRIFGFDETLTFWAERNGCTVDTTAAEQALGARLYPDCAEGVTVAGHVVEGMGHIWPHAGRYTLNQLGFDLSTVLVDYFLSGTPSLAQIAPPVDQRRLYLGTSRPYLLYVPPAYDPAVPMPLVIALHGRPGTATGLAYLMDSNKVAAREGFMLLYPDGLPVMIAGYDDIGREWNYGRALPGYQNPQHPELYGTDDVMFLKLVVNDLAQDLNIDRDRVYVTGFSNGGFMTQRVACEAGPAFAGYVVASATMLPEMIELYCDDVPPVPIMYMHGTNDISIPWDGIMARGRTMTLSAPDSVLYWAIHNGCDPDATTEEVLPTTDPDPQTRVYRYTFSGCADGADVWFYAIENGGHALPGVDRLDRDIAGNVNMDIHVGETWWDFLSQHTRRAVSALRE